MFALFKDRQEAGRVLAKELERYKGDKESIVLGLARGGVVVAYEVAKDLLLPLNVLTPRKIGAPQNPELAIGAMMENGEVVFNQDVISYLSVSQDYISDEMRRQKTLAEQRLALYRRYAPLPIIKGRIVILVDDGIATGSTILVAVKAMRRELVKKIVVAAPVSSTEAYRLVEEVADEVVCPYVLESFFGVGAHYQQFDQTSDQEVVQLLSQSQKGGFYEGE